MATKLTYEQAKEIRKLYAETPISVRKLAKQYGVSKSLIWKVISFQVYTPEKYEPKDEE